jgi:hypothetical protein
VHLPDRPTFKVSTGVEQSGEVPARLTEGLHADTVGNLVIVRSIIDLEQEVSILDDIRDIVGITAG